MAGKMVEWHKQVVALAQAGRSLDGMAAATGQSEVRVARVLVQWLRQAGRTDAVPWVTPEQADAIAAALTVQPTLGAVAAAVQVPMWMVQCVVAVRWNAEHPVAGPMETPLDRDGVPDLDAMLTARWPMPMLVRATGLQPSTLEPRIAAFLASQPEPDASPWLEEATVTRISGLLDQSGSYFALRQAQARGEFSRGQVAIVRAVRGEWRAPLTGPRESRPPRQGKIWTRAEDAVLREAVLRPSSLEVVAAALGRSTVAVEQRARRLEFLAADAAWPTAAVAHPPQAC